MNISPGAGGYYSVDGGVTWMQALGLPLVQNIWSQQPVGILAIASSASGQTMAAVVSNGK